jgi:regulatory subunit for Cdc7p protein kinase
MKIWTLEKLQRMMDAMFDQSYAQPQPHTRSHSQHHAQNPAPAVNDLSIALRNERINGPVDRDPTAFAPKEMVYFKGPFLLVRDLSEKCRPILVREYPKVTSKEDGIWPQFRSVGGGKCPFIEDTSIRRPQYVEERKVREESVKPRQTIKKEIREEMPPPKAPRTRSKRTFAEVEGSRLNKPGSTTVQAKGLQPPIELRRPAATANEIAFTAKEAVNPQRFNKEPAASGMQPSNITSAIRSNAISSHANAEGGLKAPQSRDMHGLQRKAAVTSTLEKAENKIGTYKAANGLAALAQATRSATRRIAEMEKSSLPAKNDKAPAAVELKYDPKPGYCENCKEKFDDFEEVCLPIPMYFHG